MRPDFGGHSIENMLLRNAMRSKSFSTAQTEITFLLGCLNAPSSMKGPTGTKPVSSPNSRFAATSASSPS